MWFNQCVPDTKPNRGDVDYDTAEAPIGTQCVYSFSLPKGRPSIYRAVDEVFASPPLPETDPGDTETSSSRNSQTPVTEHAKTTTSLILSSSSGTTWSLLDAPDWASWQMDSSDADLPPGFQELSEDGSNPSMGSLCVEDELPWNIGWGPPSLSVGSPEPRHQDLDGSIAQLSQLSSSLHHLHRTSRALAEKATSQQSAGRERVRSTDLIDDAVFSLVTTWLVHTYANTYASTPAPQPAGSTSTLGNILVDTFSTSSRLLRILHALHAEAVLRVGMQPPSTASSLSGSAESASFLEHTRGGHVSGSVAPSDQYYNSVIQNLIVACHTQLMSIYVAILTVLQSDVDLPASLGLDKMDLLHYRPNMETSDMRLVVIVQLVSYFCKRMCQKASVYLTLQCSSPQLPENQSAVHMGLEWPVCPGREAMMELGADVYKLIECLRQALHM